MDMNLIIVYDKIHNIYLECDVPNFRKENSFVAERKNNSLCSLHYKVELVVYNV